MNGFKLNNILKHLIVVISYLVLWQAGWYYSTNFETVSNTVSWFIPAGIRVSYLLLLPRKYWLTILISELIATGLIQYNVGAEALNNMIQLFLHLCLMIAVYMLCIHQYLKRYKFFAMNRLDHLVGLLRWIVASTLLSSFIFFLNRPGILDEGLFSLFEFAFAFVLGDLIGIVIILIPVSLIQLIMTNKINKDKLVEASLACLSIVALLLAIQAVDSVIALHARVIALFLFTLIAYVYRSLGAGLVVLSVFLLFVLGKMIGINMGTAIDNQMFLIAIALTALLVGAAIGEQKELTDELQMNNHKLSAANSELEKLTDRMKLKNQALNVMNRQMSTSLKVNQDLSSRLVSIQETERTQIAQNLHDQIGQNITAIKVNLAVTKSSAKQAEVIELVDETKKIADAMYSTTQELINNLHPRVLDEMGLVQALSEKVIGNHLAKANIKYRPIMIGDIDELDQDYALAIYRITQEAITNTIKHAKATQLDLLLEVKNNSLELNISDDGIGFDDSRDYPGIGLINIHDRVSALKGIHKLTTGAKGTQHRISFIIEQKAN